MSKEDIIVPARQKILRQNAINFLIFSAKKDEKFLGPATDTGYSQKKEYFDERILALQKLRGICMGSSSLKARCLLISRYQQDNKSSLTIHNNAWFKKTRQLLAKWSEESDKDFTDEQRKDMIFFIEQIALSQSYQLYFYDPFVEIFNLDIILPISTEKTNLPEFTALGQIFGFYSATDLTKILNSVLKKDRFIFLASHNHVGLLFINDQNKIEFFDSNHDEDDITHENVESVVHYFSSRFPKLRSDVLLPLNLYTYTTSSIDKDFPSVHEVAQLCENGEIAYSPKIPGYLAGINSLTLSKSFEYIGYFANQILEKTDKSTAQIIIAAKYENEELFQTLLDDKSVVDLNSTDSLGQNLLMNIVFTKKYEFLEILLKKKVELNTQDHFGLTALMYVAQQNNVEIFKNLLLAGCDPLIKDKAGKSVITHLIESDNSVLFEALLKHQFSGGTNILMLAVKKNDIDSICQLLPHIDVNSRDDQGRTGFFYASAGGNESIVNGLLVAGADPLLVDNNGKSPQYYAQNKNHINIVKLIDGIKTERELKTTPIVQSEVVAEIKTPLMIAIKSNDMATIQKLIDAKVDVNAIGPEGRTALFFAAAAGHEQAIELLLGAGADPLIKDKSNKTAQDYAIKNGKFDAALEILAAEVVAEKSVRSPSPVSDRRYCVFNENTSTPKQQAENHQLTFTT